MSDRACGHNNDATAGCFYCTTAENEFLRSEIERLKKEKSNVVDRVLAYQDKLEKTRKILNKVEQPTRVAIQALERRDVCPEIREELNSILGEIRSVDETQSLAQAVAKAMFKEEI